MNHYLIKMCTSDYIGVPDHQIILLKNQNKLYKHPTCVGSEVFLWNLNRYICIYFTFELHYWQDQSGAVVVAHFEVVLCDAIQHNSAVQYPIFHCKRVFHSQLHEGLFEARRFKCKQ